ncbi:MAG TPA: T9SS type A sorting domain-containing protein [Bacteroidota bacterium]|nr:T9SS type A sorting domain-containing protein [Bacteroidota bacterium]
MNTSSTSYHFCLRLILPILVAVFTGLGQAGDKYRTFSQTDLAEKKGKPGKAIASTVCFRFYNTTGDTVNDLHAKFNSRIVTVDDAGGFPVADVTGKGKDLDASGKSVPPGDSVTICLTLGKKAPGSHVNFWWWTKDGVQAGPKNGELESISDARILTEPNGGNALEYLYKRVIRRPAGLVAGLVTDTPDVGWIRYMKADRKYFPHDGAPRCLDFISNHSGRLRDLDGQLRNPHVKKHNNHLLGELHALKLAVIANDSGVTEPLDTSATLFGDLLYNDTVNTGDPCNGLTVRGIVRLADSALTYCGHFDSADYAELDGCISRINAAFGGPYTAASFTPFVLAGTVDLASVYFLHDNPSAAPVMRPTAGYSIYSILEELPGSYAIAQNYPNPFNPFTTIEFELSGPSVVSLKVYNLLGAEVASLLSEENLDAGAQSVDFEALSLPSGVYLYRITAISTGERPETFSAVRKMVLLK